MGSRILGTGRLDVYKAVIEASTKYIQNANMPTVSTERPFVDIGSNVTTTLPTGAVAVNQGASWIINAREVTIKNDFTVPLGSTLEINTSPTFPLGCATR